MGHLCDFSPPFFVWVLDVKGIILSSVEYQLAFFLLIGTSNEELQCCLPFIRVLDQLDEENREFPEENNIKNESELKYLAHPPAF